MCGVSVFVCEQVQSKRTGVHYTVSKQQPEHSQECMEVVEAMEWLLATKDGHFTTPWITQLEPSLPHQQATAGAISLRRHVHLHCT